ncbi:MAG: serine/threonine protein kinase [Candidatus Parcubacteria bacterium]|nr:serine/threonine protein kinase [Burkholderiales bacterium]
MEQTQFGRYVIVSELGRGAMGAVHRAVDPLIERDVAIKTLLPNLPPEIMGEIRERFLREARSAGRLNHPNIVTIYDVGEQDGVAYIAMELLEGKSLQQILRETPRLPVATIAELVAQVADGLDLAQRFRITHRDIKPANIMVSADWRAKLTDFGVAHVASSSMTQTGSALGSPKYMSPEQVTGQPVDPRSDIFSLGVVLYEMLVRRTPFERAGDNTVFAVMHRIAGEAHIAVTQLDPQIPTGFNAILDRALAKSVDKRYQRAGDMANDLRNFKALPAGAPGPATDYDKTMLVSRPPARPAQPEKPDAATTTLIDDLDVFSKGFEELQQANLQAEAAELQRKEDEIRRWAEAEERRRQTFDLEREAKSGATLTGQRRSAALDMLKQKVAERSAVIPGDQTRRIEAIGHIDERLRAAFRYLSEFTTVLNEANPVSDATQGVMFFGDRAGVILGEGFTDMRTRDVHGRNCADYVTFKYRVRFPNPEKLEVTGQEAHNVRERLKALGVKYELTGRKNDLGQVTRATFTMSGPFPCQAVLRGDYDEPGFTLELVNVRHHGPAKLRLGPEELNDDVLDEFGTWVLGADEAFERFLKRRA